MSTVDIPGLGMTRSLGDKAGMEAGVICEPGIISLNLMIRNVFISNSKEFTSRDISEEDKFLIIASDGVWEHLSD